MCQNYRQEGRINQYLENLKVLMRSKIIGGGVFFYQDAPTPASPPASKYYQKNRLGRARPQTPVRPVGQIQGRPSMHWL